MTRTYLLSEIQKNQAIFCVGMVGHVAHGKSTVIKILSGVTTQKHSKELEKQGKTIYLGYADLYIYCDHNNKIYYSNEELPDLVLIRHCSFIDCPGHRALVATMLSGSQSMDAAILLIAGNNHIPQKQTESHTKVLENMEIDNILILLNKIDLYDDKESVEKSIDELSTFISNNTILQNKPVVPISATNGINIDQIGRFLCNFPIHDTMNSNLNLNFSMTILRSFNINKSNTSIDKMVGGVVGGSINTGYIEIGDSVVLLPGSFEKEDGKWISRPIFSKVVALYSEKRSLDIAFTGGLISIGLDCDPSFCKNNQILGNSIMKLTKNMHIEESLISTTITMYVTYLDNNEAQFQDLEKVVVVINSCPIKGNIIKKKPNNVIVVNLEQPILFVENYECVLMTTDKEFFGNGTFRRGKQNVEIRLPRNLDRFYETVPEVIEQIEVIDDLPQIEFNMDKYTVSNISAEITSTLSSTDTEGAYKQMLK